MQGKILPSIEMFEKLWQLPKTHFILYEYFCKAVVGNAVWNARCLESDKKLCTMIAEAYTLSMLRNHYFAWLFEFKATNPGTQIKTAYDTTPAVSAEAAGQGSAGEQLIETFCGDLEVLEVSVPTQEQINSARARASSANQEQEEVVPPLEFKLLVEEGETADAYKEAKDHDQQILKAVQEQIDQDQQGTSGPPSPRTRPTSPKARFSKMSSLLADDSTVAPTDARSRCQRKRKCKAELTDFTSSTKKSKKGSDEIKGWTDAGKQYVIEMLNTLKQDDEVGIRDKWAGMYRTLLETVKECKERDDDELESEQHIDVDPSVLYGEVMVAV